MKGETRMSEARKCDRCHDFYEIPEEQQDKRKPYDLKGSYAKLLFCDNNRDYPNTVRWYDLCPNCVELLDKWLENPDNYDPQDLVKYINDTDCADRSNGATEKELELASKINDAKIYIAQLKAELGYTMSKEEIDSVSSEPEYKDPCESGDIFMGKTLDELREFCNNFSKDCSECPFYDEDLWDECSLKEEPHNWASEEEILSKLLDYKIKHPDWRKEK